MEFKDCPKCYAKNKAKRRTCWRCGHSFTTFEPTGTIEYFVPSQMSLWNSIMNFLTILK